MDIMSRVFLINEVRLYPPSERRKLIYIHSKLVTRIEADFIHECKIFVAGMDEECRFAWDSSTHRYQMGFFFNGLVILVVSLLFGWI